MASPVNFANNYFAQVSTLISVLEELRVLNDRATQDSGLVTAYFSDASHRTDIDATNFNAAKAAVVQLLFSYDSGSPAQKAALFKLL